MIALTGSIGMGKSTTARMFAEAGVPVHDADAVVHRLYQGAAAAPIEASFPGTTRDGAVDREALAKAVVGQPDALRRLEAIVHPLVRAEERLFRTTMRGHRAVLLDIPLLFESGSEVRADLVVVVTAPAAVQRARVLSRPGMSAARFESLLARQMSDAEKRRRAHALIDTSRGLDAARRSVAAILRASAPMAGRHGLNQNG